MRAIAAIIALFIAGGCAAPASSAADATGGVTLRLQMFDTEGGAAALYEVARDGTLGFGGGADARLDTIAWTGAMTAEEIAELRAALEAQQWFEPAPTGSGEPKTLTYRVDLRRPSGHVRFRATGQCPPVEAVLTVLDRIARKRFEPFMQTLPRPGERSN
jgi:hypothetical protein